MKCLSLERVSKETDLSFVLEKKYPSEVVVSKYASGVHIRPGVQKQ